MKYSKVIGQNAVKEKLVRSIKSERLPHAQIFLGPSGSGKLALAIATAQFLLCENPKDTDSCGECGQCIKVSKMIHPDLHFSYPVVGSKAISTHFVKEWRAYISGNNYPEVNTWLQQIGAENKQGNITKDECVDIIKKFSFKTFEGKYKILIMWLPEYLAKEGNRLLKLIEEPQPNTSFILVAENSELILNTILSRCQLVRVPAITDEEMIDFLVSSHNLDEEEATSVCYMATGNINTAENIIQNKKSDHAEIMINWLRKCYAGGAADLSEWVDGFAKLGRENQKHFLDYGLHFLRELLVVKIENGPEVRLQDHELKSAIKLSKVMGVKQISMIMELLNDCHYYIERNANPKILFLDASIQIKNIFSKVKARKPVNT